METENRTEIILPRPQKTSQISPEEAILKRRSVRNYKDEFLNLNDVSQILWAAQGISSSQSGGRTVPSAGATYPLEIYLAVRRVEKLKSGLYLYLPEGHKLSKVSEGDFGLKLSKAALPQDFIKEAPIVLVFSAVFEKTTERYGDRGIRYVYMETGHSAQNVYLQVQSLGLATVVVGAFDEDEVKELLNLPEKETPLYIMPVGKSNE